MRYKRKKLTYLYKYYYAFVVFGTHVYVGELKRAGV